MASDMSATIASLGIVMAPAVLDLAEGFNARSANVGVEESERACVQSEQAGVDRRFGGTRDTVAILDRGVEVEVLNARQGWVRVRYSGKRVGWIQDKDIGDCGPETTVERVRADGTMEVVRATESGVDEEVKEEELERADRTPRPPSEQTFHPFGRPTQTPDGILLVKQGYDCYYDPKLGYCRWVGYCFRAGGESPPRYKGDFFADEELPAGRAEPADYKGAYKRDLSGFDRGHMAPDGTVKALGEEAQKETYSLANITPQFSKMNQGIWRELEDAIREQASSEVPTCVETGPVFEEGRPVQRLAGPNRLPIPHAYYAIITQGTQADAVSYMVPNEAVRRSYSEIMNYATSVDAIEEATGLDFLADLEDATEDVVEARVTEEQL